MPRSAKFLPKYDQAKGLWYVSIPPKLSKTGKRARLYFPEREGALRAAKRVKERHHKFGVSLANLDPLRLGEASECFRLLDAHKSSQTLISIVREYLQRTDQQKRSTGILDAFDAFLASRPNLSAVHKQQIGTVRQKISNTPLSSLSIAEIESSQIESLLSSLSGGTRNRYLRILKAVFNYALRKEWITSNPVLKIDFATLPKPTIEIFTNEQIQQMLSTSLPFLV